MLWALLLAGGGLLIAGPVGAIIGLLIGVVMAIVSNGSAARRLERQVEALQGGDPAAAPSGGQAFWTPTNIGILIVIGVIGFISNEADKNKAKSSAPAVASATTDDTGLAAPTAVAEAAKAADEHRAEQEAAAKAAADRIERQRKAAEQELAQAHTAFLTAQTEAFTHYPATDAEIPEYESHWAPRERAARARYERLYLAVNGRTLDQDVRETNAWAAMPYTKGR